MRQEYPSYCCPHCGAFVGWIGRVIAWVFGNQVHGCDFSNNHPAGEMMSKEDEYEGNLQRDLKRLIHNFEEAIPRAGATFGIWFTPDELRLVLACLRSELARRK